MLSVALPAHQGGGTHWAAIVTSAAAVVAAGGVGFAAAQVRSSKKATQADSAIRFALRWNDPDMIETRRCIRRCKTKEQLRDAFLADMSHESVGLVDQVCEYVTAGPSGQATGQSNFFVSEWLDVIEQSSVTDLARSNTEIRSHRGIMPGPASQ